MAVNRAGLLVHFRVSETENTRNALGRFTSEGMQELLRRNRLLAEELRGQVGRRITNEIAFGGRQEASTGRLLAVSVSPRNQVADQWNVGVGRIDYLEKSTAKYWRTFEEGSAAVWRRPFIGTQLVQIYNRKGPSPTGTNLRTAGGVVSFKNNKSGRDLFVVTKEIAPAHVYRQVFEEAHLSTTGIQATRRFLDKIFTTPLKIFPPKDRWYS